MKALVLICIALLLGGCASMPTPLLKAHLWTYNMLHKDNPVEVDQPEGD